MLLSLEIFLLVLEVMLAWFILGLVREIKRMIRTGVIPGEEHRPWSRKNPKPQQTQDSLGPP